MAKEGAQMKQKKKRLHRVKFLQLKKERRMDKKLSESIKELTQSIKNLNGCTVLKCPQWFCWFTGICCCIQMIATIILAVCVGCSLCNNSILTINIKCFIILSGIILCSCIGSVVCLVCILKIHRYSLLTAEYNETIGKINSDSGKDDEKMKYTVAVYQHYCQSLTKR